MAITAIGTRANEITQHFIKMYDSEKLEVVRRSLKQGELAGYKGMLSSIVYFCL
jgi:hypothetical protein